MVESGLQTVVESGTETDMKDCRVQCDCAQTVEYRVLGGCRCAEP